MEQFVLCKGKQELYCTFKPTMIDSGNLANICTDWSENLGLMNCHTSFDLVGSLLVPFVLKTTAEGFFPTKPPARSMPFN